MCWIMITCSNFPGISIHLFYQGRETLYWYYVLWSFEIICIFFFWLFIMLDKMIHGASDGEGAVSGKA